MKKEDYSQQSLDELIKREKTARIATITLGVLVFFQLVVGLFLTFKNGFGVFTILPITFLPILMINVASLKKIKAEIKSRNADS